MCIHFVLCLSVEMIIEMVIDLLIMCLFYSDKHGKLTLSTKQQQRFAKWVRPTDYLECPCIISKINSESIKQVCFWFSV